MKILAIIPARYGSSRLEGKPLLDIAGKSMIQRVYEQCIKSMSLSKVIVATDDQRILEECQSKNCEVIMTASTHINGTERCAEVLDKMNEDYDLVINIQGDEPFIHPESIDELAKIFINNPKAEIGTLKKKISSKDDILSSSIIKVVSNSNEKALYFSRSPIPFLREDGKVEWLENNDFYKHIGMYAYRPKVLKSIVKLREGKLESAEKLEQLRWLENGFDIYIHETIHESKSIDTMEDYNYILQNISLYE